MVFGSCMLFIFFFIFGFIIFTEPLTLKKRNKVYIKHTFTRSNCFKQGLFRSWNMSLFCKYSAFLWGEEFLVISPFLYHADCRWSEKYRTLKFCCQWIMKYLHNLLPICRKWQPRNSAYERILYYDWNYGLREGGG